jgi:hypothetical protein
MLDVSHLPYVKSLMIHGFLEMGSGHLWLIVPALGLRMMMSVEQSECLAGKPEVLGNLLQCQFVHHKYHMT